MIVVSVILAAATLILTAWLVLHTNRADRLGEAEQELHRAKDTLERLLKEQREDG